MTVLRVCYKHGVRFDEAYYVGAHGALVESVFGPHGLKRVEILKVTGTPDRPRITVFRSLKHIYVQAVDDVTGATIAQASSLNDEAVKAMVEGAGKVGVGSAVMNARAQRYNPKKAPHRKIGSPSNRKRAMGEKFRKMYF